MEYVLVSCERGLGLKLSGCQGRNRTADASLFRTHLSSNFNNLQGPKGPPKYLKIRSRRAQTGWRHRVNFVQVRASVNEISAFPRPLAKNCEMPGFQRPLHCHFLNLLEKRESVFSGGNLRIVSLSFKNQLAERSWMLRFKSGMACGGSGTGVNAEDPPLAVLCFHH
jgi:hypothetical protein